MKVGHQAYVEGLLIVLLEISCEETLQAQVSGFNLTYSGLSETKA